MRTESFLYEIERSAADMVALQRAMARSGELAREHASSAVASLNRSCMQYAAGAQEDFSIVTREAHCAAFELMTYGDICRELHLSEPAHYEQLLAAGAAMQGRALDQEAQFLRGELSRSQIFFDDLLDASLLSQPFDVLEDSAPMVAVPAAAA
jgi:hypothetical protein